MLSVRECIEQCSIVWGIVVGALGALALWVACALYSYHATDSSLLYYDSNGTIILNWCGSFGAHIAATAYHLYGYSAWIIVCMLFYSALLCARRGICWHEIDRAVMMCVLMPLMSCMIYICTARATYSGRVGYELGALLMSYVAYARAYVIVCALLSACLIIITRAYVIYMVAWCIRIGRMVWKYMPHIARALHGGQRCVVYLYLQSARFARTTKDICTGHSMHNDELSIIEFEQALWPESLRSDNFINNENDNDAVSMLMSDDDHDEYEGPGYALLRRAEPAIRRVTPAPKKQYALPSANLFTRPVETVHEAGAEKELREKAVLLEQKLQRFGIAGSVVNIKRGPVVTLFEYQPSIDAKLSKIIALEDDLALALQAMSIRIMAPIPGTNVVGFEVANTHRKSVHFTHSVNASSFTESTAQLPLILGCDTVGTNVIVDLAKMPHLLVAGSTGSGKSVALNSMLMSLLCRCTPAELRLLLIDPKRLEFAPYADIPHLLFPVVTVPKQASQVLYWIVKEMERRYETMAQAGARNMHDYNAMRTVEKLPFIVVVIDELADLMMTAGKEIEGLLARIAQMARAAGIHMIVATQRPSVDVITGLIKVNFPSRISFRVTSKVDSRTILDSAGADKLLGRGDMLFLDAAGSLLRRVHGAYVSDADIARVIAHVKQQQAVEYYDLTTIIPASEHTLDDPDEHIMDEVVHYLQEIDEVSISLLQRKFRIGYNRSARIIDVLQARGLVSPVTHGKMRKVIKES